MRNHEGENDWEMRTLYLTGEKKAIPFLQKKEGGSRPLAPADPGYSTSAENRNLQEKRIKNGPWMGERTSGNGKWRVHHVPGASTTTKEGDFNLHLVGTTKKKIAPYPLREGNARLSQGRKEDHTLFAQV